MSSQQQGWLPRLEISAGVFRRGMLNRSYFGTQFGGSMFAMTDPFFAHYGLPSTRCASGLIRARERPFALTMLRILGCDHADATKTLYIRRRAPAAGKP